MNKINKNDRIGKNQDKIAYFLIVLYGAIFSLLAVGRHLSLKSYLNDLGTYDQLIWNTLHGNFFALTCSMLDVSNYLSAHFSPILIFFVPLYFVFKTINWLLVVQAAAVGLSALPVYWLAQEKLKKIPFASLVFLAAYLLYPVLHNALLYDFHEVVLAVPFASFAFYFLLKKNNKFFIVFSLLLSLSQEHLPLLVFMMGFYAAIFQKRTKFGLAVAGAALAYFLVTILFFMPLFSETGKQALIAENANYGSRYAWLGGSLGEIFWNIVSHPFQIALKMLSPDRLKYLFLLLVPVFSLGAYSSPILIILPILAINLLSGNPMTFNIFFYHSAIVAPFIFFAAIFTFKKFFAPDKNLSRIFLTVLILSSLASAVLLGSSPLSPLYQVADFVPDEHALRIEEIKKIIPAQASLSVQHNLGPHFSQREKVFRFPIAKDSSDYVLLDETDPYRKNPRQIFDFEYALQLSFEEKAKQAETLKNFGKFNVIYSKDGYTLFKRK